MNRSLTLITLLLPFVLVAQPKVEAPYQKAYSEISAMLDGEIDYSFKRAVFASENAYLDNTIDFETFQKKIDFLTRIAGYVAQNGTLEYDYSDRDKIAKYWGTFMTLKHPIQIPLDSVHTFETNPFSYDFEDYNGEKDWTKMFVTKALFTNSGNCHSLPFLYKIIVEELGEEAWLAMAPNHTYIKHLSQKNGMYNTELTTGHFPADSWMMASGYIKLDAVVNAVYMDTLSQKESIAVTMVDLAQGYQKKYGETHDQKFVLKCLDKALEYYPHYVNALILKAEIHKDQYEQKMKQYGVESPSDLWNDPTLKSQFDQIQAQYAHIHKLGYRKMPDDMYMNWLLDVEERDKDDKSERTTFEAPQPFEEYGYKVRTLTLSKGKYQEFFDQEETTEIGSVVFNRMTNSITHFITYDTVRSEATLEPEIISRWMSPDPLADERLNVSPYNFVQNNPINRIDPDGMLDMWIPEVNDDGSVSYIAEEGDNLATFAEQYNLSDKQARAIFDQNGYQTAVLDQPNTPQVQTGDAISGESVANVTGSEVLKLDWQSSVTNDSRRIDQVLFAMEYSKSSQQFTPGNFLQNMPYHHDGDTYGFGPAAYLHGTTTKLGNGPTKIDMMFAHRSNLPISTYSDAADNYLSKSGTYTFRFDNATSSSYPSEAMFIKFKGTENMKNFTKRMGFPFSERSKSYSPLKND